MKKKLAPQELSEFLSEEERPGPWKKQIRTETKQVRTLRDLKKSLVPKAKKWK